MYVLQMYTRDWLLIRYCSTNNLTSALFPRLGISSVKQKNMFGDA